jgi:hypothetical protein
MLTQVCEKLGEEAYFLPLDRSKCGTCVVKVDVEVTTPLCC